MTHEQHILRELLKASVPCYDGKHIEIGSKKFTEIMKKYDYDAVKGKAKG